MNYAKAIRIARSLSDLTQAQLAKKASIERSYLSLIESGQRKPSTEVIGKISKALQFPPHLMTLLSLDQVDAKKVDAREVEILGKALANLLLETTSDKEPEPNEPNERSSKTKHKKSSRSRTSSSNRSKDAA